MIIQNRREGEVTISFYDLKKHDKKPLVSSKRGHSGSPYVHTYGYDDEYELSARITDQGDKNKLLAMEKQVCYLFGFEFGEGEYLITQAKIKKLSFAYDWYYITLKIRRNHVRTKVVV